MCFCLCAICSNDVVFAVRDFAKDWGDRERRIAQYLGLVRRSERRERGRDLYCWHKKIVCYIVQQ